MKAKLYLLPNLLDEEADGDLYFPAALKAIVEKIEGLVSESEKGAWHFLRRFLPNEKFRRLPLLLLNEHTSEAEVEEMAARISRGQVWGLITDCGMPCMADPGARLVEKARLKNIEVQAISGPSSILLSLMLSGFSAQAFTFHGYLPREELPLKARIAALEKECGAYTQVFIEAPYRTEKLLSTLLATLHDKIRLCLAMDLTMPTEQVIVLPVSSWKKQPLPPCKKRPAVFLIAR